MTEGLALVSAQIFRGTGDAAGNMAVTVVSPSVGYDGLSSGLP